MCGVSQEGQGFYVFGGTPIHPATTGAFVVDLSVPWSTSNPVLKRLADLPSAFLYSTCAMMPNGEDIFVVTGTNIYIYYVRSNSWSKNIHRSVGYAATPIADPESGLAYVVQLSDMSKGQPMISAFNPKTTEYYSTAIPILSNITSFGPIAAWSPPLRSILFTTGKLDELYVFTPSKVTETSHGWSLLNIAVDQVDFDIVSCFASAYNGSKMVLYTTGKTDNIFILDVVARTSKKGSPPPAASPFLCGVSGDQFIAWDNKAIHVYDMKADAWVQNYTPTPTPPLSSSLGQYTTSAITNLGPSQTPIGDSPTGDTFANNNQIKIIIAIAGALLTVILTALWVYRQITKRLKTDTRSSSSDDTTSDFEGSCKKQEWRVYNPFGRLQQGAFGARPLSVHPHAIIEDPLAKRNVQEGAIGVELISQHPHALIEEEV
ncbi:hypothetical protein BGX34_004585 [Mortierella sp. NVP85]|nr:hypothetical protein BGX34_004585 [Mortierella sp. NVP85]